MYKRKISTELNRILSKVRPEIVKLSDITGDEFDNDKSVEFWYLGSFLDLDPCGKYHHCISPNGITKKCETFWNELETIATELNCWTQSGEGNSLDIFLYRGVVQ